MGSDKEEKKRLKTQAKLGKKKAKAQKTKPEAQPEPGVSEKNDRSTVEKPKVPWYKNPDWIRAIAGIASVMVALIAIIITLYY